MKKSELKELYQMMFPEYPDIVTVQQLREMLGISRQLAYDLINDGELQAIKIGNSFKIPKVSVINFVTRREKGGETKCLNPAAYPVPAFKVQPPDQKAVRQL